MNVLDLFTGIGGIRLAFENVGFTTVFTNDVDPSCKATHDRNFTLCKMDTRDIKDIPIDSFPNFDILTAGFPCQPFSIAGHLKGFEDKGRGDLFFHIVKILKQRRPCGFFLENVKNLAFHDKGKTLEIIISHLREAGYSVKYKVMNTADYGGLPQNRERIYLVGFKDQSLLDRFTFPDVVERKISVQDVLLKEVNERFFYDNKSIYSRMKSYDFQHDVVYQWRRGYIRANKSGMCPTLTANMGTGGHNAPIIKTDGRVRKLTPRECARLQGFPDSFLLSFTGDYPSYRQIGNSVSIPVVERIAMMMRKVLVEIV